MKTLDKLCEIKTNFPDADFWIVRRGSIKTVGSVERDVFNPENIGIKVTSESLNSKFLSYFFEDLHSKGLFKQIAKGTTQLVNIKISDIKSIPTN